MPWMKATFHLPDIDGGVQRVAGIVQEIGAQEFPLARSSVSTITSETAERHRRSNRMAVRSWSPCPSADRVWRRNHPTRAVRVPDRPRRRAPKSGTSTSADPETRSSSANEDFVGLASVAFGGGERRRASILDADEQRPRRPLPLRSAPVDAARWRRCWPPCSCRAAEARTCARERCRVRPRPTCATLVLSPLSPSRVPP